VHRVRGGLYSICGKGLNLGMGYEMYVLVIWDPSALRGRGNISSMAANIQGHVERHVMEV
jgi:hypothetical protein